MPPESEAFVGCDGFEIQQHSGMAQLLCHARFGVIG